MEGTSLVKILQSSDFNIFEINHGLFRKMPIKKNNDKPQLLKRYLFSCPVWLKITYKYLINIELVEFISFMVNFIDSMWPRCEFYSKKQLQSKTNFCSIFKEITTQWNSTTEYFSIFNIKVCNICTKSYCLHSPFSGDLRSQ